MGQNKPPDFARLSISPSQERRLRRLAILLAAQLPDNPDHALIALRYAMSLVRDCGPTLHDICPRQLACLDYHSMAAASQVARAHSANDALS